MAIQRRRFIEKLRAEGRGGAQKGLADGKKKNGQVLENSNLNRVRRHVHHALASPGMVGEGVC